MKLFLNRLSPRGSPKPPVAQRLDWIWIAATTVAWTSATTKSILGKVYRSTYHQIRSIATWGNNARLGAPPPTNGIDLDWTRTAKRPPDLKRTQNKTNRVQISKNKKGKPNTHNNNSYSKHFDDLAREVFFLLKPETYKVKSRLLAIKKTGRSRFFRRGVFRRVFGRR